MLHDILTALHHLGESSVESGRVPGIYRRRRESTFIPEITRETLQNCITTNLPFSFITECGDLD